MNELPHGLSAQEALLRLKRNGPNSLSYERKINFFTRFIQKLANPLILLLLAAALISAVLGQISDVVIIIGITVVSICLDVYQEWSATGAAEKLRKRVSLTATVIRDGTKKVVPLREIVVGDVVCVTVGNIVPADSRIISSRDLLVDESTLTGEAFPQEKRADENNILRMGTNIVTGDAVAEVTQTGKQTQLGKIADHLVAPRPQTEFERGINGFGVILMRTAIIVSLFVFGVHVLFAHDIWSSLLFVLALAIGFAPELLPMVITINLSRGAIRMSKHGVIVKSLPSIENFGSMDILATDKTGTLTENKIILEKYEDPEGKTSEKVLQFGYVGSIFQSGFRGPMEDAILTHKEAADHGFARIAVIPFDFYRKRVSVVVQKDADQLLITKGASEEIIQLSTTFEEAGKKFPITDEIRRNFLEKADTYGKNGLRVLGVAYRNVPESSNFTPKDETDLVFLGFMAFLDPAKKTAAQSLSRLTSHTIGVKILTGDSLTVTQKICSDIGLSISGVILGSQLAAMKDEEFASCVEKTTIFARMDPDMKVRVIAALRKNGHVVGYLGDGINDAPALRAADVGISVENGTDVAKLSADIILLNKDLHVLMEGVHEGRVTFANVLKYLKMNISSNFGNMMSIAAASVFLPFLPMLPVQVLLNDLMYDVSQLTLASDRVEERYLTRPRRWNLAHIRRFMLVFGPVSSVFDLLTFGILLWVFHAKPAFFQTGWFLESIVTQTLIIFSIRTQAVPFYKSHPSKLFACSLFGVVLVAAALPYIALATGFSFVKMPPVFFVMLVGILAGYFMVVEALKGWFYRSGDV